MQATKEAPVGEENKCPLIQNIRGKGKEKSMTSQAWHQRGKENQILQDIELNLPKKSKLPVPSRTKAPPDFQKMHQAWQNQFQKGKAVSKKSSTRPCPFNLTQKGDKFRVAQPVDMGHSATTRTFQHKEQPKSPPPYRDPLSEVLPGQKKLGSHSESSHVAAVVEFKPDPSSLDSILSHAGVSCAAVGTNGKFSLARRVPMRASSTAFSLGNTMVRNSMYTVPSTQSARSELDRMSCFPWLSTKGAEQPFKKPFPNKTLCQLATSKEDCVLQSQVNPVLQQMNLQSHPPSIPEINVEKEDNQTSQTAFHTKGNSEKSKEKHDSDPGCVDFVADSQALASILSDTGVTAGNYGKLSMAQRVPVQSGKMSFRSSMVTTSLMSGQMAPNGYRANATLGNKDTMFSPCPIPKVDQPFKDSPVNSARRVPAAKSLSVTTAPNAALGNKDTMSSPCPIPVVDQPFKDSPVNSARRVPAAKSSSMVFSSHRSTFIRQPIFPKTPRALALEMANQRLEAESVDIQTPKSTVKWADAPTPSTLSDVVCEDSTPPDHVAMRLFLDGESPEDSVRPVECSKKKQMVISGSPPIPVAAAPTSSNVQNKEDPAISEKCITNNGGAADGYQALILLPHLAHLGTRHPDSDILIMPPPTSTEHIRTSLPLSFLAHPALQDIPSSTLGPCSLPHIARLRLHATVTAKQKFWDTCLDDECAFYTSRGASSAMYRKDIDDPVATTLDRQEGLHFIPIPLEET
ncbi:tastin [Discoglossus pictus]